MLVDVAESYQVECWLMLQATLFSYRQHCFPHTAQLWRIWGVQLLTQHGCHCHDKLSLKTPGWENMYASRTTVTTWFLSIFKICTFLNRSWNIRRNVKYTHTHTHTLLSLFLPAVYLFVSQPGCSLKMLLQHFADHLGSHWSTTRRYFSTSWKTTQKVCLMPFIV